MMKVLAATVHTGFFPQDQAVIVPLAGARRVITDFLSVFFSSCLGQ